MATPKSTVKSTARQEAAKTIIAGLPRDPLTGRLQKRPGSSPAPAPIVPPVPPPAGGPAGPDPFVQSPRGLRRFTRRISE